MKHHSLDIDFGLEDLSQMPGDRFALAVLVGRQVELVGLLQGRAELLDYGLLVRRNDIRGNEPGVHVDSEPLGFEVSDMAHRSLDGHT